MTLTLNVHQITCHEPPFGPSDWHAGAENDHSVRLLLMMLVKNLDNV